MKFRDEQNLQTYQSVKSVYIWRDEETWPLHYAPFQEKAQG